MFKNQNLHLKRLRELEPEEGSDKEDGVVEQPKKREFPVTENDEEGSQQVEEAREVESVGPEEDAARGANTEWETKEPLERGGSCAPQEPLCVTDLGAGREKHAGENGDWDQWHGEAVDCGDGAKWDGTATPEDFENEVEGNCSGNIGGHGGY